MAFANIHLICLCWVTFYKHNMIKRENSEITDPKVLDDHDNFPMHSGRK